MIRGFEKKKEIHKNVRDLTELLENTEYKSKLDEFIGEYARINEENKICIVFAGEYSTGKSSVIKALTGDQTINTGITPTTDEEKKYDYKGYCVVDTPGLFSGNSLHDKKAFKAYEKADAIVFCISANNLFTSGTKDKKGSLERFIEIYRQYGKLLILCVTKIDLETPINQVDYIENIRDSIEELLKDIEFDNICFISAEKYLAAQQCEGDEKIFKEMKSRMNELISYLDRVGEQNTMSTKCYTLSRHIVSFINRVIELEEEKRVTSSEERERIKNRKNEEIKKVNHAIYKLRVWTNNHSKEIRENIKSELRKDADFQKINDMFRSEMEIYIEECKNQIEELFNEWIMNERLFVQEEQEQFKAELQFLNDEINSMEEVVFRRFHKPPFSIGNAKDGVVKALKEFSNIIKIPTNNQKGWLTKIISKFKFKNAEQVKNIQHLTRVQQGAQFIQQNFERINMVASILALGVEMCWDISENVSEKKLDNYLRNYDRQITDKIKYISDFYVDKAREISGKIFERINEELEENGNELLNKIKKIRTRINNLLDERFVVNEDGE